VIEAAERRATITRRCAAIVIGLVVVGLMVANLVHPVAKGPLDNGDFKRIFAAFSSGPDDVPFWPEEIGGHSFQRRFWYFHRFWRLDGGVAGAALPSTSDLLFAPGRLVRAGQPPGFFDLTANAVRVALLLGVALMLALAQLRVPAAFVSLSLIALVMSDANLSGYLASFFQESGAFVYLLLYACALWVFWERRTRATLLLAVAACALLTATRLAYAPTACLVIAPALAGIATSTWPAAHKRRMAVVTIAAILASLGGALYLLSDRLISQSAAYIFTFTTALPALPEAQRAPYLASLDVDPSYVSEAGGNPFDPRARSFFDPYLGDRLGTPLLVRAVARLALDHPGATLHLLRESGAHVGFYPPLMHASEGAARPGAIASPWSGWSTLHAAVLRGWVLWALVLALVVALGLCLLRTPTTGWPMFFWAVATSFFLGAVLQALISMFGNGLVEVDRHNFLASMLLDVALIAAGAGLWQIRTSSRARHATEPALA
jgi:hypothetical protein